MTRPTCYVHESVEACDTCVVCRRPVCSVCATIAELITVCPHCAGKVRRAKQLKRAATILGVLALVGGLGFLFRGPIGKALEPKAEKVSVFDYGEYTAAINRLNQQLHVEPCDRVKVLQLVQTYFRTGDYRSVIRRSDAFIKRCGKHNRLLWSTYEAHKRLNEWDEAVAVASALIADRPHDKDFRWWRGIVHEEQGRDEKAAADYRQSISLEPRLRSIPFNLANVYEKMGRPCAAIFPLEQLLHHHPSLSNSQQIRDRVDGLYRLPRCAHLAGRGRAVLEPGPDDGRLFVGRVSVNGGTPGRFIVDTRASYVTLTSRFAAQNKISAAGETLLVRNHPGSNVTRGELITVDSLTMDGLTAREVEVLITDLDQHGQVIDGLLGLSFLTRFNVRVDRDLGQLVMDSRS